ncbi:MAG: phospholipase D-like domain-containing protein [Acidimicrobiales bacterium]
MSKPLRAAVAVAIVVSLAPAAGALTSRALTATATPSLQILEEPQSGMTRIDDLLSSARTSVDLEIYELSDQAIEAILANDVHRGVDVRVILNEHYTESDNAAAFSYLTRHVVHVHWAPSRFDITHEKAAVIDNRIALVTTMNFTPEYYSTTRDVVVIDSQPSDVRAIARTFEGDWDGGGRATNPSGDLLWSPGAETALVNLISSAHHSIYIENEEMDEPYIETALEMAARREVKVVVVMTQDSEWNAAFNELRSTGVEIRLYPYSSNALYIHAKVVDVDPGYADQRVFVGSENFSVASLLYNRELGIITSNRAVVKTLASMVERDADGATESG